MKKFYRNSILIGTILLLLGGLFFCGRLMQSSRKYIAYDNKSVLSASICLWKDNKQAAYTIAFDDARPSHYTTSGPELSKRKMVGTFNLNTAGALDWHPWSSLAKEGHELASHTVHHVKLTTLTEDSIRWELQQSKQCIERNVPENGQVLSFTNPFGLADERVQSLVKEVYLSERDNWGINDSSMTPDQLYNVKGVGVYPPFDQSQLIEKLEKALKNRGWILVYFHTVTENPDTSDKCQCPLDFFLTHLDFVQSKRDSLWIATQRDVAQYIVARHGATLTWKKKDQFEIDVKIVAPPAKRQLPKLILSIKLYVPDAWVGRSIEIRNSSGEEWVICRATQPTIVTLKINQNYQIRAFK